MDVAPTVDGEEIESETVEVESGETKDVEFTVTKEEAGNYTVSVHGRTTILEVTAEALEELLIGHSPLFTRDEFFRTLVRATQYYCQAHEGISQNWMNPHNTSAQQIKDMKYMIQQGVDGIIASPISASACASVVDTAYSQNIPTVTYNTDAPTKNVAATVMVNNETLGAAAAEALIEKMKKAGVELEGTAVIDGGDKTWPQAQARTRGFEKVFEEYPGLEIVKYWNEGWDMKKAKDKMTQYLIAHGKPLIAVGVNNTTNSGVIEALRAQDALVPRSQPNEHVWTAFIGLNSVVQEAMKNGYAEISSNQPNLIYGTLALYLVERCIRNGPTPLADPGDVPEPGDTVIADPSKPIGEIEEGTWNLALPKPTVLSGVDIAKQKWTPCPVVEKDGHPWIVTEPLVVEWDKAYTAPVYVNLAPKWLE
ncbi:hypothetical protein AKJ63_01920 [candidate division MSBL1 archaeon SCGC-AAA259D18]|uniref:Periplasmic binding protein domain-containing protein n=1 Tax=candidate division MSBL1 archaeon SCGC-AAA259D18 TaxID=1698262 RepID=A0A133UA57_9EURY|nr:hypothetical protein AKJ63_01920 [candidate division MSBL1 archaeon SCGC-AAA259D18]